MTNISILAAFERMWQHVVSIVGSKADVDHAHDDKYYTETEIDTKLTSYVPKSRTVNGKALSSNITLSASDVGALPNTTSIPDSLSDLSSDSTHRTVTDSEKATWNAKSNFSGSYNDLTNKPTIPSISGLASTTYVDDIASTKVDKVSGKGLSTNDYTTTEKNKLSGIATGAEVNQNAFSNVVVGSTTIAADSKTDSLTIAAGTGISVSGDATNDKVTITNSGVRSISTGGTNGTISVNTNGSSTNVAVKGLGSAAYTASTAYDAAGTAQTKADSALASAKSYTDGKIELLMNNSSEAVDSIMELATAMEENSDVVSALETAIGTKANASDLTSHTGNKSNPHGVTLSQLGVTATAAELNIMDGVTATAAEINVLDGVTATTTELNYVDGVTSNIQTQLNAKQATITGAATTITGSNLTASRALVSNSSGKVAVSAVTSTELGYLDGVTSAIQTQLDGKVPSTRTVNGKALSSNISLTAEDVGAATSGHTHSSYVNQNAFSNVTVGTTTIAADSTTDTLTIVAGSNVTITPDATNDKITIAATDTTYSAAGSSLGLVKSGGDVTISSGVITVNDDSHAHVISNVDGLQAELDAKQATITGGASTITGSNLTASRALVSDGSGKVAVSAVTSTELGYLDGVTSAIQTQLNGKASTTNLTNHTGNTSNPHGVTAAQVGAVPTSRTVNGKALSSNITLSASDVGAAESGHNHAASNITSGTLSSDRLPTVPVAKGGTGATTVENARTNLSVYSKAEIDARFNTANVFATATIS